MSNPLPSHVEEFLADYLKQPATPTPQPTVRVRASAEYQASLKAMVPDVTVEVETPFGAATAVEAVRQTVVAEFRQAFNEIRKIINENPLA